MSPGHRARLLKLTEREFRQLIDKPAAPQTGRKFKPTKINPARFDSAWDRKRGAAMRLAAILLREDDDALKRRVCEDDRSVKTYTEGADWLARESAYLRKVARLLDNAGFRVTAVLGRCQSPGSAP